MKQPPIGEGRRRSTSLPSALQAGEEIAADIVARLHGRRPVLFLDYDGTLTPIVERPEDALLPEAVRAVLQGLARRCPVAVVSGRGLDDVRDLVGIDEIYYAGSHGYCIAGPNGSEIIHEAASQYVPAVDDAEAALKEAVGQIAGAQVERKDVAVAVHFRRVAPADHDAVKRAVRSVAARCADKLVLTRGKMVFELRPNMDWDKGRAVLWLLDALDLERPATLPIFIGDDTTDEDAFVVVRGWGFGIVVREEQRRTAASHALDDPADVRRFLEVFGRMLDDRLVSES